MSTSVPSPPEGQRPTSPVVAVTAATPPAGPPSADDSRGILQPRDEAFHDTAVAHLPELKASDLKSPPAPPERSLLVPLLLFLATCASTFWVGVTEWQPVEEVYVNSYAAMGQVIAANWRVGLQYMVAVLAILLTHEMGHFLQTVKYHIPASYPLCIPVPFNAIGTMGAVIRVDGSGANRKQIFDIGIAGPLAGLAVAIPVLWWGIKDLDLSHPLRHNELQLNLPWLAQWMLERAHPQWADRHWIGLSELNPYFMAGWVGMLITGLNMLPISQLDGGHTIYALFLKQSYVLTRWFLIISIFYLVINLNQAAIWAPMLILVILMGIHHPPTANDRVELGPVRWAIGLASLAIPLFCFPLEGLR